MRRLEWEKIKLYDGAYESAGVFDVTGDGRLDIFLVMGRADGRRPQREKNYGRAFAIRAGKGEARKNTPWLTFRGSSRRGGEPLPPPPKRRKRK